MSNVKNKVTDYPTPIENSATHCQCGSVQAQALLGYLGSFLSVCRIPRQRV